MQIQYDENNKVVIPSLEYLAEASEYIEAFYEKATKGTAKERREFKPIYNKTSSAYNKKAGRDIYRKL